MKKISIPGPGGYEKLTIVECDLRQLKDNEVHIEVHAFGVNFADVCIRWGLYESAKQYVGWPITPGFEWAGVVKNIGSKVSNVAIGQEVFGVSLFNAYATDVIVPSHQVFSKPKNISMSEAAGIPAVYLTAYYGLFQNIILRPQSTILIHSAAGGVGGALVQMAKIAGHKSVGIIGSSHKRSYVEELGADLVIDKKTQNWFSEAKNFSQRGYDIVFDANGQSTLKNSFDLLAPMGKLVSYGFHSMLPKKGGRLNWFKLIYTFLTTPRFNPINMTNQNKSLISFNLSFLFDEVDVLSQAMGDIVTWIESGQLKAPKVTQYSFSNVADAHRDIESGQSVGKLIILTK